MRLIKISVIIYLPAILEKTRCWLASFMYEKTRSEFAVEKHI